MSLYEILAIVALAAAGGYAWHLYRSDMRSPRTQQSEAANEPMFARTPRERAGEGKASGDNRK